MKYLKLAFLSIRERLKTDLVLVFQLIVMFVLINYIIGSVSSRTMLSDTYRSVLDKQGWYISYHDFDYEMEYMRQQEESGGPVHGVNWYSETAKKLSQLEYPPEILAVGQASVWLDGEYNADIYVLPDEVFDDITLPIRSTALGSNKLLVFPNKSGIGAGDEFTVITTAKRKLTLKATGILTDPTYIPTQTSWSLDGDISMLYDKVSGAKDDEAFMITSVSSAKGFGFNDSEIFMHETVIAYYPEHIDDAAYERMTDAFRKDPNMMLTPLSELKEKSDESLKEDLGKYVPLAAVIIIVVILGTAGAIAIQTLDEMKNYAVMYLCGMKWRRTVLVSLCKVLMLLLAAVLISVGAMMILHRQNISAELGLAFGSRNIYISLALAGVAVACSVILPVLLLRRSEPAEIMRRIKND